MIVLDTHVILWDALEPNKLSRKAKSSISHANANDGIVFCEISLWEIAMLIQKERVQIDSSYLHFVQLLHASNKYEFRGITPEIAKLSVQLPSEITNDPADRTIAATALINNIPLVTADKNMRNSKVISTVW